jgi:hypothetical protein
VYQAKRLCPEDIVNANTYLRRELISSYVWNGAIVGYPTASIDSPLAPTFKMTKFKASNILQWENDEKNTASGAWNDFSDFPVKSGGLTYSHRHGKAAQIGRLDGSAARIPMTEMTGMALNTTTPSDLWYNPNSANGH